MNASPLLTNGVLLLALVGCGEERRIIDGGSDASLDTGAPDSNADAAPDASDTGVADTGASDTAPPLEGIEGVLISPDGPSSVQVASVLVTYLRPGIEGDLPGFFVQSEAAGPALYVQADPPTVSVGDLVSFRVTMVETLIGHKRATAHDGLMVLSAGNDVTGLVQDASTAADLVSNLSGYANELIRIDLTITGTPEVGGVGFTRATIETPGIMGDPGLQLRMPDPLWTSYPLATGCTLRIEGTPLWPFNAIGQVSAWDPAEVRDVVCP